MRVICTRSVPASTPRTSLCGGCDYTAGSNDYLNPYQQYDYNCLVYPAGCGYYNGMLVPNYPAYGGGGYTPPNPPPSNINVRTTAPPNPPLQQCVQAAYSNAQDALLSNAVNLASLGKSVVAGIVNGAVIGCVLTAEGGCVEGAVPGAIVGGFGGSLEWGLRGLYSISSVMKQLSQDVAACNGAS